ncbi:MAG: ABC transporter ATP-binding protein [Candidatus Dormibacteraceae bacterium]
MSFLEVHDVSKRFGGLRALDGASLTVRQGSITGLIGPNGSGKTTMLNVITGYEKMDAGRLTFCDRHLDKPRPDRICMLGIGRTFQLTRIFGSLTVRQNLVVGSRAVPLARRRELYSSQRLDWLLDFIGLRRLHDQPGASLSYGQRKLLELAIILAQDPKLVLLDEPAGGINPTLIGRIAEHIKELNRNGMTFLVVEHNMEFVMGICHEITVMQQGRVILTGAPEVVRNDPRVLDAYLGGALDGELEEEVATGPPGPAPPVAGAGESL